MLMFLVRRLAYILPMLFILSILAFMVMQLQPGDFLTKHTLGLPQETIAQYRELYGLDQPAWVQYAKWVEGIVTRWDFGVSFETKQPVFDHLFLNGHRMAWSLILILIVFLFCWLLALPLGIYLSTYAHAGGGAWSGLGIVKRLGALMINGLALVGLSLPSFLMALLILWVLVVVFQVGANFGLGISGLFDVEYRTAPWSFEKFVNFLWHLWPILLVVGLANLAQLIRYTRAEMLDVLGEPYVQTARAKGVEEGKVIYRHTFRNALNPLISLMGIWIPLLFEGLLVASYVFNLPTVEFAFWRALVTEDQYVVLAGLLFFGLVLIVGNLLADVALTLSNPKIRYE